MIRTKYDKGFGHQAGAFGSGAGSWKVRFVGKAVNGCKVVAGLVEFWPLSNKNDTDWNMLAFFVNILDTFCRKLDTLCVDLE
jgi:hypothetical protein